MRKPGEGDVAELKEAAARVAAVLMRCLEVTSARVGTEIRHATPPEQSPGTIVKASAALPEDLRRLFLQKAATQRALTLERLREQARVVDQGKDAFSRADHLAQNWVLDLQGCMDRLVWDLIRYSLPDSLAMYDDSISVGIAEDGVSLRAVTWGYIDAPNEPPGS
jgi:hypothetical protein